MTQQTQVALITGASSGIGEALSYALADSGYHLALLARRLPQLQKIRDRILSDHPERRVEVHELDVTDTQATQSLVAQLATTFGQIDLGIVNAGMGLGGAVGKGHLQGHLRTIEVNLLGAMATADALMEVFRKQNNGHLVAISSVAAARGFPKNAAYSASKAALSNYFEAIRIECLNKPITITTLHPGFIDTPINADLKSRPFLIDVDRGAKIMLRHIQKKSQTAYVPGWPWALVAPIIKMMPRRLMRYF